VRESRSREHSHCCLLPWADACCICGPSAGATSHPTPPTLDPSLPPGLRLGCVLLLLRGMAGVLDVAGGLPRMPVGGEGVGMASTAPFRHKEACRNVDQCHYKSSGLLKKAVPGRLKAIGDLGVFDTMVIGTVGCVNELSNRACPGCWRKCGYAKSQVQLSSSIFLVLPSP
jgi:hypothetical protein